MMHQTSQPFDGINLSVSTFLLVQKLRGGGEFMDTLYQLCTRLEKTDVFGTSVKNKPRNLRSIYTVQDKIPDSVTIGRWALIK